MGWPPGPLIKENTTNLLENPGDSHGLEAGCQRFACHPLRLAVLHCRGIPVSLKLDQPDRPHQCVPTGARSNGSRNPFSRNLIPSIFRRAIYDRIGCVGRGLACSASSSSLQSSLIRPPRGAPSRCSSFIACMQVSSSFLVRFFSPIIVQQVLFWGSEHGLHAIRGSTERPVLSRQVVVTSASVQALVLRADS